MNMRQRQSDGRLLIALMLMAVGGFQASHAIPGQRHNIRNQKEDSHLRQQALIADVVAQARRDAAEDSGQAAKNGSVYFVAEVGSRRYEYRMKDWRLAAEKTVRKQPGSGMSEDWANVRVDMLDSHKKSNVQGADWLFHYSKGRWQRVALNEGPGYERKRLRELGMSDAQSRRLNLEVNE